MEPDLREVLKKAVLSESYGAGTVGGKVMKKKRSKAGVSNLSMLGPVENSNRLKSLVKEMIDEEIAKGGLMMKKKRSSRRVPTAGGPVGGFIGKHPIEYSGGCDHCSCCGGALGGAEYEERCRMVRKKAKPMKHLFPYQAAMKAMTGIKFNNRTKRTMEVNELAESTFDPKLSIAANAKRMREYFIQYRLPDLVEEGWIKLRAE